MEKTLYSTILSSSRIQNSTRIYGRGSTIQTAKLIHYWCRKLISSTAFIDGKTRKIVRPLTGLIFADVIIAIGNAKFSQVSKGYPAGCSTSRFYKELLAIKKRLNYSRLHVHYVNEYHTSQACYECIRDHCVDKCQGSNCCHRYRVVEPGTNDDKLDHSIFRPIDNSIPYQVMHDVWQNS